MLEGEYSKSCQRGPEVWFGLNMARHAPSLRDGSQPGGMEVGCLPAPGPSRLPCVSARSRKALYLLHGTCLPTGRLLAHPVRNTKPSPLVKLQTYSI